MLDLKVIENQLKVGNIKMIWLCIYTQPNFILHLFINKLKYMKNCIVYLSHVINDNVINRFLKIKYDVKNNYDIYFIFDSNSKYYEETKKYGNDINFVYINSQTDLNKLKYKRFYNENTIGIAYWFLQYFVTELNINNYDNYWLIEYDVVFSGNYNNFFNDIDDNIKTDFVSQYIENYNIKQNWHWWINDFTLYFSIFDYDENKLLKSFNPIFRISKRSILFLDEFLKKTNITGHYEYLLPTLLYNNNFSLFFKILSNLYPCSFIKLISISSFFTLVSGFSCPSPRYS